MKMFKSKFHRIQLVMLLGMFALGRYFYDRLPEMITMQRNIDGVADRLERKNLISVFLLPIITLLVLGMMKLAPCIDPRKRKYQQFSATYTILQTVIVWSLLYFYAGILLVNLYPNLNIIRIIFVGIWALMLLIWNYLPKIRRNYFVGIKTPWTLNNEEVWNKTHRLGGIYFFWIGISLLINSYFLIAPIRHMRIVLIIGLSLFAYSYLLSRQKH